MTISAKIEARDNWVRENYPDFERLRKLAQREILHEARTLLRRADARRTPQRYYSPASGSGRSSLPPPPNMRASW